LNAQSRYIPKDILTVLQSWHLNIQREIPPTLVVDAAYVGSHSVHLMALGDWNQAVRIRWARVSLQAVPLSNFNAIEVAEGIGFAVYHSFQLKVEKRYSNGLYAFEFVYLSKGS